MAQTVEYRRLWLLVNALPQGAALLDAQGNLLFVNKSFAYLTEIPVNDLIYGTPLPEELLDEKLYQFTQSAIKSASDLESEIVISKNNQARIFLAKSSHLFSDEAPSTMVLFDDITRIKHLEQMRQDFVSNVSHELRTPVTSIKGASETLINGALENPQDAKKFTEIIFRQSERLSRIIEDLLSLSKIEKESDSSIVDFSEQDLCAILGAAARNSEHRAQELGMSLSWPINPEVRLAVNRTLLEQAVGNLVENAIEHSERGSSITLSINEEDTAVTIEVTDQGCGIPEAHLKRIFERFYRVDKSRSRKFGGTGLGLAIVKHVALAHRGHVEVTSRVGVGSSFAIVLPKPKVGE